MKQYRTINNLVGWLTFIIAATVYCLTIEPTASFWDCPEFITTGYKLEVGHPPGAPFFMLMANLFTQFASDVTTVAKMVNYMSALMSGACILFLFWSITHLVRKLIITDENNITKGQLVTIMGSGLVGALVYTFSDTFWFSAVEGEVYAFSSLFTAVVFWLILKWEDVADQPHSDRWIILIAYLTGLSIGVHLLNLLCLPAIVLVYYYKKTPNATAKGSLLALFGSMVLVAAVLYGIVPGIVKVGGWFELLFVNGLGMPFNTGVVVYIILLAAALIWGVYESYTQKSKARMAVSFILTIALLGIPFYGHGASSILIGILVIGVLAIYLAPHMQEIKVYMTGWLNYYGIASLKTKMREWDEWLRHRIRAYIWKQWKKPKTKLKNLMKLGVPEYYAYMAANSRRGYWFTVNTGAVTRGITKERLTRAGFFELSPAYESIQTACIGRAVYRTVRTVR